MACRPPDRYQFQIRRTLGAGTHYLKVEGYDENETGPLHRPSHRRRQPGNTTATAQALTLGQAQDTDHFSITVEENTHVSIWAVHDSASLKVNGELLNGTGQSVVEDYLQELAGNHGCAIEHLLTAGTHYLKVKGNSSTGKYTVAGHQEHRLQVDGGAVCEDRRQPGNRRRPERVPVAPEEKNPFPGRADRDINVEPVWTGGNSVNDINAAAVDKGMKHLHAAPLENVAAEKNHDYNGANQIVHPLNTHGTTVAGIIAAMGNAVGVRGAAQCQNLLLQPAQRVPTSTQSNEVDASRNSATTAVSNNSERPGNGAVHELAHRFWRSAIDYGIKKGYGGKGVLHAWVAGNLAQEGDYSNLNEYANHWDDRASHSEMGSNLWVCAPSSDLSKDPTISTATNQGCYRDDFGGISAATHRLRDSGGPTPTSPGGIIKSSWRSRPGGTTPPNPVGRKAG